MESPVMLMIDIKSEKVCFVEARSNVVEFLAGLLSLPLGTALDLLTKERMVGNIGNVLGSVEKLGRVWLLAYGPARPMREGIELFGYPAYTVRPPYREL
ncbi:hypothetical protein D1007_53064 [Hordeum vulgare]|nr:hypothetical protein D1007_53064 [Hordeum vulgare]